MIKKKKTEKVVSYVGETGNKKDTYLAEDLALLGVDRMLDVGLVSFQENDNKTSPKQKFGSNPDDDDKVCDDLRGFIW